MRKKINSKNQNVFSLFNTQKNKNIFFLKKKIFIFNKLLNISRPSNNFFRKKREITRKIIFHFSICVFLFLVKNRYFLEAKFFLFKFCSNISFIAKKTSIDKIFLRISNKINQELIIIFLRKKLKLFSRVPEILENFRYYYGHGDLSNFCKDLRLIIMSNKKAKKKNFKRKFVEGKIIIKKNKNYQKNLEKENIDIEKKKNFKDLEFYKLIKIYSKYSNNINCVDLSSDEKTLTIGYQNSLLHVYNLLKNEYSKKAFLLKGHSSSVFCVKKVKFGDYVLSSSLNGELYLWGLKKKTLVMKYQNINYSIWDLAFTKNETSFLTVGSGGFGTLWYTERPLPVRFFIGHIYDVNTIKWHPDMNFLVTGSDDKTVRLWDIRIKKSIGKIFFEGKVNSLDFSPDGSKLLIGGTSCVVNIFDMRILKSFFKINEGLVKDKINEIVCINNEKFAYVKDNNQVKIWSKEKNWYDPKFKNYRQYTPFKIFPSIEKIFQLRKNEFNKITIIGLK